MEQKQIIYSLKAVKQLMQMGFVPVQTMPNPLKPEFKCWLFDVTDDFQLALNKVLGGMSRG